MRFEDILFAVLTGAAVAATGAAAYLWGCI
jgi:hypothetical protein